MNGYKKICISALMSFTVKALAVNPVGGIYAGINIGGSTSSKIDISFQSPTGVTSQQCGASSSLPPHSCPIRTGALKYEAFGSLALDIGYRMNHWRAELQPWVNYNPYGEVKVDGRTLSNSKKFSGLKMKGSTTAMALMLNGYYDFYSDDPDSIYFPYVGLGIGYANIDNHIKTYCNFRQICTETKDISNKPAAQAIIGGGMFLDDFTWFGLDYRYFVTQTLNFSNHRLEVHSINLSFIGSLRCLD